MGGCEQVVARVVEERVEGLKVNVDIAVSMKDVSARNRKMANWKAPGRDGVGAC